jgi:hypothetical protein
MKLPDIMLRQKIKRPGNKYGNTKCVWRGEKFDSKRELERHLVLLDMQKRGEIAGLERQPRYTLTVQGIKVCDYIPDWRYWVPNFPRQVCEDCKGFATPEFKLKFRIAKICYPEIDWRLS